MKRNMLLVFCFLLNFSFIKRGETVIIEKKASDFIATNYLTQENIEDIKKSGYLRGIGEAEYQIDIPTDGWYEFYVAAAEWPTDIFLDGHFLIYTPFDSGVWQKTGNSYKVMNLYFKKGIHTLKFSRIWHPGLPYMTKFFLRSSEDITGMVRVIPVKDYLVFRKGESFPVKLQAGRIERDYTILLTLTNVETGEIEWRYENIIQKGEGNYEKEIVIPTDKEGVFDLKIIDKDQRYLDRIIQFCVIDTKKAYFPEELKKELIYTIDASKKAPDYQSRDTRVIHTSFGSYRESGDQGREKGFDNADWFAYTLNLPSIQEPYMLEIEYPDDDRRTTPIVLVEANYGSPEPAIGYFTGGPYPLSNKMQTLEFYFFPRAKNPRLLFLNWNTGQRAAVSKINVYRITDGFPPLKFGQGGRMYGMYQEEPLRFVCYFGAMPEGDHWLNLYYPAQRVGQLLNYTGANLWNPTISVYQCMLWPGKTIPGYQIGILPPGPATTKEPFKKDVMRLMLLVCEKYGLNFIGELHTPPNLILMRYLDKRFGGKGTLEDDGYHKPWLAVSKEGEVGLKSPYGKPYYNAIYPGVQEWTEEVIKEIVNRYKDSPAFKGVAIRFMGWTFGGWQGLASINYGYEDYTIELFERETGIKIPVEPSDPERFKKRYYWLMTNVYDSWVAWRCRKIYEYHKRLSKILTDARPDLKLYIDLHGANFGNDATAEDYERKGWIGLLKEAGIDPSLYANSPSIILRADRGFPDGGNRGSHPLIDAVSRDRTFDLEPIEATAKTLGEGTVSALYFGTNAEGPYVKYEKLGYSKEEIAQGKKEVYPDAVLYPAGIHYLERFANAMADGNFVWISEGSHGYGLGQPKYLRQFLSEYRALPEIGMKLLGNGDPVALWYGREKEKTYFYVVNRTYYPVDIKVSFTGGGSKLTIKRLASGESVKTENNILKVKLEPYQLIAYVCLSGAIPNSLSTNIPDTEKDKIKKLIESAEKIVIGEPSEITVLGVSPVELKKAEKKIAEAKQFFNEGRYWKARQVLMHSHLIKIYEAVGSYPSGLFFKKAPSAPLGALMPEDLYKRVVFNKKKIDIIDGKEITPYLANEKVFRWKGNSIQLKIEVPFKGLYRISYGYPVSKLYKKPILLINNKKIEDKLPFEETTFWGRKTTIPFFLNSGNHNLIIKKTSAEGGLFFLHFEPVYTVIGPEYFYVLGPFEGVKSTWNVENVYQKMSEILPPEKELDLSAVYEGLNNLKVRWIKPKGGISPTDPFSPGYIDLYKTFGVLSNVISFGVTYIESPDERKTLIKFGADYWAKIWLNGEEIFTPEKRPPAPPKAGEISIPVTLKKGINILLIKIHAGSAGNGFWVSILDSGDLKFSAEKMKTKNMSKKGKKVLPFYKGSKVLVYKDFVVEIMDPNDPDRYNRGVRFTPVAGIIRVNLGENEFLFHQVEHDPLTGVAGLFAEFDLITPPPGFTEAKMGEGFVKIGVGVLKKDVPNYQFWRNYEIIKPARTEVIWGKRTVKFHQVCEPYNGYGYELDAIVSVGERTIVVDWRLKNIGSKQLETHHYVHNCFLFNRQPIGPGYIVSFPYDFQARGLQNEQRQVGRIIQFIGEITKPANIEIDYPADYSGPNILSVYHTKSGHKVNCLTSLKGTRTALHVANIYVCPEQFIMIRLLPGESITWSRSYRFTIKKQEAKKGSVMVVK